MIRRTLDPSASTKVFRLDWQQALQNLPFCFGEIAAAETCLQKAHNDSLFVFDDVHWSAEMEMAWAYIKAHPSVTVTIDLFAVGLVFFRKQQPKQNFVLRWPFWK